MCDLVLVLSIAGKWIGNICNSKAKKLLKICRERRQTKNRKILWLAILVLKEKGVHIEILNEEKIIRSRKRS